MGGSSSNLALSLRLPKTQRDPYLYPGALIFAPLRCGLRCHFWISPGSSELTHKPERNTKRRRSQRCGHLDRPPITKRVGHSRGGIFTDTAGRRRLDDQELLNSSVSQPRIQTRSHSYDASHTSARKVRYRRKGKSL